MEPEEARAALLKLATSRRLVPWWEKCELDPETKTLCIEEEEDKRHRFQVDATTRFAADEKTELHALAEAGEWISRTFGKNSSSS